MISYTSKLYSKLYQNFISECVGVQREQAPRSPSPTNYLHSLCVIHTIKLAMDQILSIAKSSKLDGSTNVCDYCGERGMVPMHTISA